MKRKSIVNLKRQASISGEPLKFIEAWYDAQCDGEWEHGHGVKIDTSDNPGWSVEIDLTGTMLEGRQDFNRYFDFRKKVEWMNVTKKDKVFYGYGGPSRLADILEFFREWTLASD